jgi:hypothetical protein
MKKSFFGFFHKFLLFSVALCMLRALCVRLALRLFFNRIGNTHRIAFAFLPHSEYLAPLPSKDSPPGPLSLESEREGWQHHDGFTDEHKWPKLT